ncbi:MAG: glutathione peroxidase [Bacteroidota bacterium]
MKTYIAIIGGALLFLFVTVLQGQQGFHDFVVKDINGFDYKFSQLEGKKVLVVNTASNCALTPQYKGLEKLYSKYADQGLVIIAFPCNDFGSQEPGTNKEIAEFCSSKYEVTFPVMAKIEVKGEDMHPLYKWLTQASENGVEDSRVAWNFQKYMIDEEGRLVGHVPPRKKPGCKEIINWLQES